MPSPTSSACRRRSWPTTPSRRSPSPPSATSRCTTGRAGGTASPSSSQRRARGARRRVLARPGGAARRGAHRVGDVRGRAGREPLRPERPLARARAVRVQARVARARCATTSAPPATRPPTSSSAATSTSPPTTATSTTRSGSSGSTHVTPAERAALQELLDWGLVDVFRQHHDADRPVLVVGLPRRRLPPAPRAAHRPRAGVEGAGRPGARGRSIDRNARKGKPTPSDHAPLVVEFEDREPTSERSSRSATSPTRSASSSSGWSPREAPPEVFAGVADDLRGGRGPASSRYPQGAALHRLRRGGQRRRRRPAPFDNSPLLGRGQPAGAAAAAAGRGRTASSARRASARAYEGPPGCVHGGLRRRRLRRAARPRPRSSAAARA